MGWLIVSLALMAISAVIAFLAESKWDESFGLDMVSSLVSACSFLAALLLAIFLVSTPADEKAFIEKYNNKVEIIQNVKAPSEEVIEEIFDVNGYILNEKVKSARFMTKGLYSKKVGELPLLEIPEGWYKNEE